MNALFGALSAASQSLAQLVVLRLLAGLGVGGSIPVVFSTMSEFCNTQTRWGCKQGGWNTGCGRDSYNPVVFSTMSEFCNTQTR